MSTKKVIGERLFSLRHKRDLSQEEMAAAIGISLRAYQSYERGERDVSVQALQGLHALKDVDLNEFLTGTKGVALNLERLSSVVVTLESELAKRQLVMPPQSKARLIVLACELLMTPSDAGDNIEAYIHDGLKHRA